MLEPIYITRKIVHAFGETSSGRQKYMFLVGQREKIGGHGGYGEVRP